MDRAKAIVKVSVVGILVNLILVAFKAAIGLVAGSISIISDALNNLSDAISSIVTIIGTLFAGKRPDKKHPYGYGKIEHVSSLIIAIIIIGTGVSTLLESWQKIIHPELADFNIVMLVIIFAGILVKFFLGRYFKARGKKLNSDSLVASGTDALFDVLISTSTLIGAMISFFLHITIDGWIGLVISIFILKTGLEIMAESFNHIVGSRTDADLSKRLKKAIDRHEGVLGVYDLALHHYGPERIIGSVHIEVEDNLTAKEIHLMTREIADNIFRKFGIILTIGIYATNTENTEYAKIKAEIKKLIKDYPTILQMHGYYVDSDKNLISVDLVFDYEEKDIEKVVKEISKIITEKYPGYKANIVPDNDFTD